MQDESGLSGLLGPWFLVSLNKKNKIHSPASDSPFVMRIPSASFSLSFSPFESSHTTQDKDLVPLVTDAFYQCLMI